MVNEIKIIDDFLPARFHAELKSLFEGQYVNWFHSPNTTTTKINLKNVLDSQLFNHNILYNNEKSMLYNIFHPFHYFIESSTNYTIAEMFRIRANFTFPVPGYSENNFSTPHVDAKSDLISAIYYVNDSDGDTFFFKGNQDNLEIAKRVSPKANRMVFFPSNLYHSGSNPIKNDKRIVVNFMFSIPNSSSENVKIVGVA